MESSKVVGLVNQIARSAYVATSAAPSGHSVLGYSGGIDSGILASLLSSKRNSFQLLALGRKGFSDLNAVRQRRVLPNLTIHSFESSDVERAAKRVAEIVRVTSLSHFEDCAAFWLLGETAVMLPEVRSVLSANGPDELFCGYDRFRRILDLKGYSSVEEEMIRAIKSASNLSGEVAKILSEFGLTISEPFLSEEFRMAALSIPVQYKILTGNDLLRKRIWRCFGRFLGLPEDIVLRPKKAMQYGMGLHQIISKMLKRGTLKLDFRA